MEVLGVDGVAESADVVCVKPATVSSRSEGQTHTDHSVEAIPHHMRLINSTSTWSQPSSARRILFLGRSIWCIRKARAARFDSVEKTAAPSGLGNALGRKQYMSSNVACRLSRVGVSVRLEASMHLRARSRSVVAYLCASASSIPRLGVWKYALRPSTTQMRLMLAASTTLEVSSRL